MFDVSRRLALKCRPSYFSVSFLDMDGLINQYTILCFVGQKYPIKTSHGHYQKRFTPGYIWISKRAWCVRYETLYPQATGQWRIRRFNCILAAEGPKFFVQNWTKKLFFANKDPKTNFDAWMILRKHVLSFKCNDFFKMANLKAISSSATLTLRSHMYISMLHFFKFYPCGNDLFGYTQNRTILPAQKWTILSQPTATDCFILQPRTLHRSDTPGT